MEKATHEERLKVRNPEIIQLYSVATPNGIKVAACLEELAFIKGDLFDYEPHSVDIRKAENRTEEFASISPIGKIPAIVDPHGLDGRSVHVFESGAILMYLAEKFGELMPRDPVDRVEVMKWLFWGSATLSDQVKLFGFYFKYCPHGLPYCIARYTKECNRLFAILDKQLSHGKHCLIGGKYIQYMQILLCKFAFNKQCTSEINTKFEFYRHVHNCGHLLVALDLRTLRVLRQRSCSKFTLILF